MKTYGLNITLSVSEKSLKEQIKAYLDSIKGQLEIISTMDNQIEILAEYKQNLDLRKSVLNVAERKQKLEAELKKQERRIEQNNKQVQTAEKLIDIQPNKINIKADEIEIVAPTIIEETVDNVNPKQYEMTFTVKGTMEQLKALKKYLKENNLINE